MASNYSFRIVGAEKVTELLKRGSTKMKKTMAEAMREGAFVVEGAGKRQITSGRNRAIDTGYLRASIGVKSIMPFRATVQAGAHYGVFVHEGTRYMRARPFLLAGLKDSVPQIERIFGKRIKTLLSFTP